MKYKIIQGLLILMIIAGMVIPAFFVNPQPVRAASDMVQTIVGGGDQYSSGAATRYYSIMGRSDENATAANIWQVSSVAGTLSNFYVRTSVNVTSHTYTLRISNADTAMSVTLTGASSGSYTASSVALAFNSALDIKVVSTDAAATPYIYWTVDFTPTGSTTASMILGNTTTVIAGTRYTGVYGTYTTADATETNRSQVMPTAGTFSDLYVYLSTSDPGAVGDAYSFTLMKNGVATALTCTITDPDQSGSDTVNSVSVVAGDLVSIMIVPINVPASTPVATFGVRFDATNNYESLIMGQYTDVLNAAASEYNIVGNGCYATSWTATEANVRQIAGYFTVKDLYISLSGSPDNGVGTQSYTLALRNTGTTTALSVTISETDTTGNNTTAEIQGSRGEFLTMIATPVGTPTARFARWSMVLYYNPDAAAVATWDQCVQKDYFTTGGDAGGTNVYGATYAAMSFTTTSAYSICYLQLSLQRTGTPGTLTVAIKGTDAFGNPTGDDLASGTFAGDTLGTAAYTWSAFTLTTSSGDELSLQSGTKYAIVLKALNGTVANYVQWYADTGGGYASGGAARSTDGGSTWDQFVMAGYDYLFEFWGKNSIAVISAKVFQNYKQTGDWIVVFHYYNKAAPYYPNDDVTNYWSIYLNRGTTAVAKIPCQQWGERPGAIYLNALKVIPLEWDKCDTNDWNIELVSASDPTLTASYTMVDDDWRGTDLDELDAFCLGVARSIEDNAVTGSSEADLLTDVSDKGEVLNDNGAVIFSKGIQGLATVRPNLFLTTTQGTNVSGLGISFQPSLQDRLGTYVTGVFNQVGEIGGLDGRTFGMIIILVVYIAVVAGAFTMGHSVIALAISLPFIVMGMWLGLVEVALFCILGAVVIVLLMRQTWTGR